jgi:L-fuculose-phosphate aldolase
MTAPALRRELVEYSQRMHRAGWVANHDGNITVRVAPGRWLATPTALSKGALRPEMLIEVDAEARVLSGTLRPFGELPLHLAIYGQRPDVHAVMHAHPPHTCAMAVSGVEVPTDLMAEPVVSLGERIPLVPYRLPGAAGWKEDLGAAFRAADAVVMAQHGPFTCGPDLETAWLRMELVEHLARICWLARGLGGPAAIPADDVRTLVERRRKAGLGPAASLAAAHAADPAVQQTVREITLRIENQLGAGRVSPELTRLIVDEIVAATR